MQFSPQDRGNTQKKIENYLAGGTSPRTRCSLKADSAPFAYFRRLCLRNISKIVAATITKAARRGPEDGGLVATRDKPNYKMPLTDDLIRKRKRPSGGRELIWTDTHASFLSEQLVDVNDNATMALACTPLPMRNLVRCGVWRKTFPIEQGMECS